MRRMTLCDLILSMQELLHNHPDAKSYIAEVTDSLTVSAFLRTLILVFSFFTTGKSNIGADKTIKKLKDGVLEALSANFLGQ